MPTTPPSGLLDRNLAKAQVRELLDIIDPLLREVVNYGVALFARCSGGDLQKDVDVVVLLTYLHIVEMADAAHALLAEVATVPARLQLRSVFEGLIALEYMTTEDTERRALSYHFEGLRRNLSFYRSLDAAADEGREARARRERGEIARSIPPIEESKVREEIRTLEAYLARARWVPFNEEFARLKKERHRSPRWYTLFGGPATLADLADRVGRGGLYDILYKQWSGTAHVEDIKRHLVWAETDRPTFAACAMSESSGP